MTPARLPVAVCAAALLTLTACGGGPAENSTATAADRAPSVAADATPAPTGLPNAAPSEAPAATAETPATSTAPAPAGAAPSAAAPAPARASAPPAGAGPGSSAAPAPRTASSAPRGTRPGRYAYDVSGTVTAAGAPRSGSGTATFTVDPLTGNRQTAVLDGDNGRTETEVELRSDGRYLVRLQLTTPGFSKEFLPPSPVLLLPTPLVTGQSWTWTARSTDGQTTVTTRNRVTGDRTQTVGGTRVATAVVETTLTLRGDVVFDGTTTTDYDPERSLPVRERSTGKGTARGVAFTSDTRSALRALDPS